MPCSIKGLLKILDDIEHGESKIQHGRSKIHILRAKSHVSEIPLIHFSKINYKGSNRQATYRVKRMDQMLSNRVMKLSLELQIQFQLQSHSTKGQQIQILLTDRAYGFQKKIIDVFKFYEFLQSNYNMKQCLQSFLTSMYCDTSQRFQNSVCTQHRYTYQTSFNTSQALFARLRSYILRLLQPSL